MSQLQKTPTPRLMAAPKDKHLSGREVRQVAGFFVFTFRGWFSALILLLFPGIILAGPVLRLETGLKNERLGPYLELYRGAPVDAASVPQTPDTDWAFATKVVPSFGMDNEGTLSYWARFQVENPTADPVTVYLANHYPPSDHMRVYAESPNRTLVLHEQQGDYHPYSLRSVRHRFPVFRMTLAPGLHTYYVELQSLGSIQLPLQIWEPDAFTTFAIRENLMLGGIMGMCLFALIYNLFVFLRLKADVYFLYVLHNISICLFLANFLGFTQIIFLPDVANSWWLTTGAKLVMDVVHITAISFTHAFLDLKKNAPRWHVYFRILQGVAVLTLLNTLTWKFWFNTQTVIFSMVASFSLLLASLAIWKKFIYARYYAMGWSFLLLFNIATMLSLLNILPTHIVWISWAQSIGHCFELCLLSLALGERMAWINRNREETLLELTKTKSHLVTTEQERVRIQAHLLDEREQHIRDLDRKVAERTRDLQSILNNLNQGIFAIRLEEGRCLMDPDYSPYLHSILGSFESRSADPVDLLFSGSPLGNDERSRIRSILIFMMDDDRIAFDLNSGLLPREIQRRTDVAAPRILEVDWDPMVDSEGHIQKILVAVRDVTEYRALRSQLRHQSEDLQIARDLLQDGSSAPVSRIAAIASDLDALAQGPAMDVSPILRRLHALKGDSRTLLLGALSEALHEAESIWLEERRANERSLKALAHAAQLAHRYHEICSVFERRFRRSGPSETASTSQTWNLHRLLELGQLPGLAKELGKKLPQVELGKTEFHLSAAKADALRECFGHLLRNAMDHGLESPAERSASNKPEQGCIIAEVREEREHLIIIWKDDGRGLHLTRIREKAKARGLNPFDFDDQAAAQLIFEPELSTKDEVTLISGRGIGLDAVRDRVTQLGGSLHVELLPDPSAPGFRAFALHLRLPRD